MIRCIVNDKYGSVFVTDDINFAQFLTEYIDGLDFQIFNFKTKQKFETYINGVYNHINIDQYNLVLGHNIEQTDIDLFTSIFLKYKLSVILN